MSEHTTATTSRIAGLAADSQQVISGVAIGEGDVTRGLSGDRKVWEADELRAAADSLVGVDVTPLHSETAVGTVTGATYEPDVGVVYEAELNDAALAERVAQGGLEVSVEARHRDGGTTETPQGEAMRAADIEFTGLAVLQHGAAPSASAESGEAAALAPADIRAALGDFGEGDRVAWDFSGDTANGRVAEIIEDEGDVTRTFDGTEVTRDSDEEPAYVLDVWRDGEYSGQALKSESELSEWSDPPKEAQAAKHMDEADLRDVPDEYVFQNPGAATGKAEEMGLDDGEIHQHGDGDEAVFMPGSSHESLMEHLREEGLLGDGDAADGSDDPSRASSPGGAAALQTDPTTATTTTTQMSDNDTDIDPQERVTELKAELSDRHERIAELEAEVEQLRDERDDVARAYAEALCDAGETVLNADDLVDRFEVSELRERLVEVTDADTASAALADAEPAVQSGGGTETETADLSEAEQAEAAEHREVIAELAGKGGVAAHERRHRAEQLAEITGEDPETILEQHA